MATKELAMGFAGAFGATVLVTWLQIRAYGVICTLALLFWLFKNRYPNTKVILPEKLIEKLTSIKNSFIKLRSEKPGAFCSLVSVILIVLAIFGHIVSGQWLIFGGIMIAGVISTKHKIRFVEEIVPDDNVWPTEIIEENDEFLPEVNESTMYVLEKAGESAIIPQKDLKIIDGKLIDENDEDDELKNEQEIPIDLMIPENSLPEIDENSLSSLSDQEDEQQQNLQLEEMKFKSKHFKQNTSSSSSSSSDDDSITKGLSFQDLSGNILDDDDNGKKFKTKDIKTQQQNINDSNFKNLVQQSVSNILQNVVQQQITTLINPNKTKITKTKLTNSDLMSFDSSDDDYEFINSDDINS